MLKVMRGSLVLGGLLALYALNPVLAWVVLAMVFVAAIVVRQQQNACHDIEKTVLTP